MDRRAAPGLVLDAEHARLRMGVHSVVLPPGVDNGTVLIAYLELVSLTRHEPVANLVEVRHEDVEALAAALDLDAHDLEAGIQRVLGATHAQAQAIATRLRSARPIGGLSARVGAVVMPRET
jgi:hypothetical protein